MRRPPYSYFPVKFVICPLGQATPIHCVVAAEDKTSYEEITKNMRERSVMNTSIPASCVLSEPVRLRSV